jgi:hypothetical protein
MMDCFAIERHDIMMIVEIESHHATPTSTPTPTPTLPSRVSIMAVSSSSATTSSGSSAIVSSVALSTTRTRMITGPLKGKGANGNISSSGTKSATTLVANQTKDSNDKENKAPPVGNKQQTSVIVVGGATGVAATRTIIPRSASTSGGTAVTGKTSKLSKSLLLLGKTPIANTTPSTISSSTPSSSSQATRVVSSSPCSTRTNVSSDVDKVMQVNDENRSGLGLQSGLQQDHVVKLNGDTNRVTNSSSTTPPVEVKAKMKGRPRAPKRKASIKQAGDTSVQVHMIALHTNDNVNKNKDDQNNDDEVKASILTTTGVNKAEAMSILVPSTSLPAKGRKKTKSKTPSKGRKQKESKKESLDKEVDESEIFFVEQIVGEVKGRLVTSKHKKVQHYLSLFT